MLCHRSFLVAEGGTGTVGVMVEHLKKIASLISVSSFESIPSSPFSSWAPRFLHYASPEIAEMNLLISSMPLDLDRVHYR
jgi:hypothetical protein